MTIIDKVTKSTDIRFFAISARIYDQEEKRCKSQGMTIKTNVVQYVDVYIPGGDQASSMPVNKIPHGPKIEEDEMPTIEYDEYQQSYTSVGDIIYISPSTNDVSTTYQQEITTIPEQRLNNYSKSSDFEKVVAKLIYDNTSTVHFFNEDRELTIPTVQRQKDDAHLPEFDVIIKIIKFILDTWPKTVNMTPTISVYQWPFLLDILSRIKDFKVTEADENTVSSYNFKYISKPGDWVTHGGTYNILRCNELPIKVDIMPCVTPIIDKSVEPDFLLIGLCDIDKKGVKRNKMVSAVTYWNDDMIQRLKCAFTKGYVIKTPGIDNVGKNYRILDYSSNVKNVMGVASLLGRGTLMMYQDEQTKLAYAIGTTELSRLALSKRTGYRKYTNKIPYIVPSNEYFGRRKPTISEEQALTFTQKMLIYQLFDDKCTMMDVGSGNYYNIWMTEGKIIQVDQSILDPSPIDTITNLTVKIVDGIIPTKYSADVVIGIDSIFFSSQGVSAHTMLNFIESGLKVGKRVAFNFPYVPNKHFQSTVDAEYLRIKNNQYEITLASYDPVPCMIESEFKKVLTECTKKKIKLLVVYVSLKEIIETCKFLKRSVSTDTLIRAYILSKYVQLMVAEKE
jgi:hypothetical protein